MCRAISLSAAFHNRGKAAVNFLFVHGVVAPDFIVVGTFLRKLVGERGFSQCFHFFKAPLFGGGAEHFVALGTGNFRPFHFHILFAGGLCGNQAWS